MASISAVTMPKWGIEMTEGAITGWRVEVGQRIERGSEILDVETEKIVNAVESPASGILRRILAGAGVSRPVGALIGVIADADATESDIDGFIGSFVGAVVSFEPATSGGAIDDDGPARGSGAPEAGPGSDETRVSPIARRLAERLGIDLSRVTGTGRNGRISKEDVEAYAARSVAAPPAVAPGEPQRIPMSARRIVVAKRLAESKQTIPHYRLAIDVDFTQLLAARRDHASESEVRVTLNDLILRATGLALGRHPAVNAQFDGHDILQFSDADVAIAVTTEAGLITPVVRAVNRKLPDVIARESRDLVERARAGTLAREDISGGSFTVSNLGMFGIDRFDAIINPPQVAILAVGAVIARPVANNGVLAVGEVATLTLSADHRVIDGALGAAFMATLRGIFEQPRQLWT